MAAVRRDTARTMSQENVEIVRMMLEAFLEGDYPASLELLHPEVEWHETRGGLDDGRLARGHDQVVAAFIETAEAWESQKLEVTDFIDADEVVVVWHEVARGKGSGVEVETETAVLYSVEDGKVVRVFPFMDRKEALEAAGLSE